MVLVLDLWSQGHRFNLSTSQYELEASCSHTCTYVTEQYSLVLGKGYAVALVKHYRFSYGLNGLRKKDYPMSTRSMANYTLPYPKSPYQLYTEICHIFILCPAQQQTNYCSSNSKIPVYIRHQERCGTFLHASTLLPLWNVVHCCWRRLV